MNLADEIERLQKLHQSGALSDEEFARAKAAVLAADGAVDQGGVREARCYKCGEPQERSCVLCGKLFCGQHGGERLVWLDDTGGTYGARSTLTKRVICDDCTPSPAAMKRTVALLIVVVIVALVFILGCAGFLLMSFFRS